MLRESGSSKCARSSLGVSGASNTVPRSSKDAPESASLATFLCNEGSETCATRSCVCGAGRGVSIESMAIFSFLPLEVEGL